MLGLAVILTACSPEDREMNRAMILRDIALNAERCSFTAEVTADYGELLHSFSMDCASDRQGNVQFEITQPETLEGIKGTISDRGGEIDFEDTALYFPLLADEQLTPAAAPWIFLKIVRSGSITSVCREDSLLHMTAEDIFQGEALLMDIWLDESNVPVRGEVLFDGKRILTLSFKNLHFV